MKQGAGPASQPTDRPVKKTKRQRQWGKGTGANKPLDSPVDSGTSTSSSESSLPKKKQRKSGCGGKNRKKKMDKKKQNKITKKKKMKKKKKKKKISSSSSSSSTSSSAISSMSSKHRATAARTVLPATPAPQFESFPGALPHGFAGTQCASNPDGTSHEFESDIHNGYLLSQDVQKLRVDENA